MNLLKGGTWQDGVDAGVFYTQLSFRRKKREFFSFYKFDTNGLPDRWKQIVEKNERTKRILLEKLESALDRKMGETK